MLKVKVKENSSNEGEFEPVHIHLMTYDIDEDDESNNFRTSFESYRESLKTKYPMQKIASTTYIVEYAGTSKSLHLKMRKEANNQLSKLQKEGNCLKTKFTLWISEIIDKNNYSVNGVPKEIINWINCHFPG